MRRTWTIVAGAGLMALGLTGPAATPAGGAPAEEEHCVLTVVGRAPDGELRTAPMVCAPTRSLALALAAARGDAGHARLVDWPIGTHYDGAGFTGSSVTVVGADCTGGWLNLPTAWNDRISSTLHGCPLIRHHLHANLTGTAQTTGSPGGNLGPTLNNETSSIQYLP